MSNPSKSTPLFRRVFDKVERLIGEPLEGVVTSHRFVEVAITGFKARRAVTGALESAIGGVLDKGLRAAHIATRDDLKHLTGLVAGLATEVRTHSAIDASPGTRKSPSPARKPAARKAGGASGGAAGAKGTAAAPRQSSADGKKPPPKHGAVQSGPTTQGAATSPNASAPGGGPGE